MASGIAGMSRALDKYGINIRVANLQQELYNLGIDATVSSLSQSDKAILRTITILNSSKYAWGDLANTINQPANQLRLLQSNFSALSRTIGSLFIPIISKILPYMNAFVIAIQRAFSWIGRLLGIKMSDYVASTGSAAVDMGSIADSTEDAASGLDKTNDNAKKLQKSLSVLSFDELNQLNDAKVSNSSGSSGSGGGGSAHLPELDAALDKALSEYQAAWDKAFEEMNNKANDTADQIVAVFKKIRKAAKPTTESIKKLYSEGLSKLGNFSITALKDLWNNYLKPIGLWMLSDNSGLPRFFNITNDLLNKINWGKLNSSLSGFFTMLQKPTKFVWTGLMDFYEKFLVPVGTWTMNSAIPELVDALTNFGNNIHWDELNSALKNFWDALAPFAQNVGQGIVDFFKDLLDVGENFINTTLPGGLNSIADAIKNISPETAQAIGKGLGQISIAILGFKGLTFIGGIIGKDSPLGKGLALLAKHPYAAMALGISGIVLALDNFGVIDVDWEWIWSSIDRVKTSIQNFIDKVDWNAVGTALGNLWSAFQPFAEGFADALITGLEGIINIGADLINGIANAINWLAEKLSGVDPEFIKQVGAAFGTLFAIKIAKDIATKIFSFASGIGSLASKLLNFPLDTASSLPTIIGDIGGAAETAATGGLSSFSSTLGTIFGTSGIVFVATALSVKLARGIASIITGNYNKDQRDRTKWYSINEDVLENILNGIVKENQKTNSQCASGQNDKRHRQNDEMHKDSSGEALPENTNKNYHSENTISDTTSPTELKKEKKNAYHSNEWFNSQHIKNMLTEENIQYTPIDRKSFNWSAFKNQVSVRIEELGYTTSPYTTNRFLVISKYFFKRYEERTRKPHIKINQDALDNILDKFGFGPNPDYFQNVEIETYMKVIDEYFGTSFSEYTDHHYSHFMSGYIRKNLLMKVEDREDTL